MTRVRTRGEDVRRFILENVSRHPRDISRRTAERFGITRQAVNKHLRRLADEKTLVEEGATRSRIYKLASVASWSEQFGIAGLEEDMAWRERIAPALGPLPDNVRAIWHHGFTEMCNNAIDHSEGSTISVSVEKTAAATEMMIRDDGVGIFRKIQRGLDLADERHAVLELAKGKLTTDPKRHSGEGIFFTSRMFDRYQILSGGVFFSHEFGDDADWILEPQAHEKGTIVSMQLSNHTSRTTRKVFDQFSSKDGDYRFNKTVVPVRLAQYGDDQLVSRSQAKRLLARVELFSTVVFDFREVRTIGQAFADEIFRVFAGEHPGITMEVLHANSEVKRMIERARSSANAP